MQAATEGEAFVGVDVPIFQALMTGWFPLKLEGKTWTGSSV